MCWYLVKIFIKPSLWCVGCKTVEEIHFTLIPFSFQVDLMFSNSDIKSNTLTSRRFSYELRYEHDVLMNVFRLSNVLCHEYFITKTILMLLHAVDTFDDLERNFTPLTRKL